MKKLLLILGMVFLYAPLSLGASNDAGISSFTPVEGLCPGSYPVEVKISNYGDNRIDSVTVQWSVDGVTQTPFTYRGLLDTLNGSGINSVSVNIGNYSLAAGQSYNLKVWTTDPNGVADVVDDNDTLIAVLSLQTPGNLSVGNISSTSAEISWDTTLSSVYYLKYGEPGFDPDVEGTGITVQDSMPYTIDGLNSAHLYDVYIAEDCGSGTYSSFAGPISFVTSCSAPLAGGVYTVDPLLPQSGTNFVTLGSMAEILAGCGVSGPVTVNVAGGTYHDQMFFENIGGASAANPVVIQADPANTSPVEVINSGTNNFDNYVITFNGVSHVTVRGMTLTALGSQYARVIDFFGINQYVTVEDNILNGYANAAGNSTDLALIRNSGGPNDVMHSIIRRNQFNGGSYGIYWFGPSPLNKEVGNIIDSNVIEGFCHQGIHSFFQQDITIRDNELRSSNLYHTQYGLYFFYTDRMNATGNRIALYGPTNCYGIYFGLSTGTSLSPGVVANNMISIIGNTASAYGINVDHNTQHIDIVYNSVLVKDGSAFQGSAMYVSAVGNNNLRVFNNNFVNTGGGVALSVTPPAVNSFSRLDYNNYHVTGTHLANWNGPPVSDLAGLRSANSMDAHSQNMDPQYTDSLDLHLNNPGLNAKGLVYGRVTVDIDNDVRSVSRPDIGVDEKSFLSGNCTHFTDLVLDSILDTTLKVTWTPGVGNSSFKLEYDTLGFTPGTGTVITGTYPGTEPPVYISGLTANTEYEIYLTEYCNSGADSSYIFPEAFRTLESCPEPTEPVVLESKTDTSITFSFGSSLNMNNFEFEYGHSGFMQGTGTIVNGGNPMTIDGLAPGTAYDFYIRGNCPGHGSLPWFGPFTFTTVCIEAVMPYYQSFSSWPPACMDTTGGNDYWIHGNQQYAGAEYLGGVGNSIRYLTTPPVIIDQPARLRFSWSHAYYNDDKLKAEIEVNGSGNWQLLTNLQGSNFESAGSTSRDAGSFVEEVIYLDSAIVGDTIKIRFISDQAALGNAIFMDDIFIEQMPPCPEPESILLDTLTPTSVSLYAVSYASENFEYEYGLAGYTAGNGTLRSGGDSITITGLNSATAYDLYIRTDCSGTGKGNSIWSGPLRFITPCGSGLSGTYTIDPGLSASASNFISIDSAVGSLNMCGVSGPVVFNIKEGVYNEQIDISGHPQLHAIIGASAVNTITFRPDPSNVNPVEITYDAELGEENFIVRLTNSSHVIFRDLIFRATGEVYGRVVEMSGGNNKYITFENDSLITALSTQASSERLSAIYADGARLPNEYITIKNNVIKGGYHAIYFEGNAEFKAGTGMVIDSNHIIDWNYSSIYLAHVDEASYRHNFIKTFGRINYPVYIYYCANSQISHNDIDVNGTSSSSAIYVFASHGTDILGNRVKLAGTGPNNIGLRYANSDHTSADRGLIANNMIVVAGNTNTTGMYIDNSDYTDIVHNSMHVLNGSNTRVMELKTMGTGNRIINNNLVNSAGGYTIYAEVKAEIDNLTTLNYNNYYSSGNNLAYYNGAITNLIAWRSGTGKDISSLNTDPLFVSPDDLHALSHVMDGKGMVFSGVDTDIDGEVRSAASPDIGADEYVPASGDLGLVKAEFVKNSFCLSTSDTVALYIRNIVGGTVDFSQDSLVAHYNVTGPVNTSGSISVKMGTLATSDTLILIIDGIDLSLPGTYSLDASIDSSIINLVGLNDELSSPISTQVDSIFTVSPGRDTIFTTLDSMQINAHSPFFSQGGAQNGLSWTLNGNIVGNAPEIYAGPHSTAGDYSYVATFVSPCGITYKDTVVITIAVCNMADNLNATNVTSDSATLSWNAPANANSWTVIYGTTGFDPESGGTVVSTTNNPLRIGDLTPLTSYDFYVILDCGTTDGQSDTAGPHTFQTVAVACDKAGSDANVTVCDTIPDVDLSDYLSGADAGGIWIDADATGALTGSIFDATAGSVSYNNTYAFHYVIAGTADCPGDTSVVSVTIDSCEVGIDEHILSRTLRLYPNPASSQVKLTFNTGGSEDVEISLTDLSGKEIYQIRIQDMNGYYSHEIPVERLSAGSYLLKVQTMNRSGKQEMRVVKRIVKE